MRNQWKKPLTPSHARALYTTNDMSAIQKHYNISWNDLAYMLLHNKAKTEQ